MGIANILFMTQFFMHNRTVYKGIGDIEPSHTYEKFGVKGKLFKIYNK